MSAVVTKRFWNRWKDKRVEEAYINPAPFPGCCGGTILCDIEAEVIHKPLKKDYGATSNSWWLPPMSDYPEDLRRWESSMTLTQAFEEAWRGAHHDCDFLLRDNRDFGGIIVLMDAVGIETGREHGDAFEIGPRHLAAFLRYEKGLHVTESPPAFNPNTGAPVMLWTVTHNDTTDTKR